MENREIGHRGQVAHLDDELLATLWKMDVAEDQGTISAAGW
jgi:hypothetical protein